MGQEVPGTFNLSLDAYNTATETSSTQECVGKYCNNDISIVPSPNMANREVIGIKSCLIRIRNDEPYIHHRLRKIYCGYANLGITRSTLRQQKPYIFNNMRLKVYYSLNYHGDFSPLNTFLL